MSVHEIRKNWIECDRCGKEIPPKTFDDLRGLIKTTRTWTERFLTWSAVSRPRFDAADAYPHVLTSRIHLCEEDWEVFLTEFLALGKRPKPESGKAFS